MTTTVDEPIKCATCSGRGTLYGLGGSAPIAMTCPRCHGSRVMPVSHVALIVVGRAFRADRLSRRLSLRTEAGRLGITGVELSRREQGMPEDHRDDETVDVPPLDETDGEQEGRDDDDD